MQTYKRLDIGTAKPTASERATRPHFLFDIVEPGDVLTAGDFRRQALKVLHSELPTRPVFWRRRKRVYIQALEKGMFDVPKPKLEAEAKIRALPPNNFIRDCKNSIPNMRQNSIPTIIIASRAR